MSNSKIIPGGNIKEPHLRKGCERGEWKVGRVGWRRGRIRDGGLETGGERKRGKKSAHL